MKMNKKFLLIKLHFFFFFAAIGPIFPQLSVYGKELGISSVVMGTLTGILPILCLLAKPIFGLLVDIFRNYRKCIFISLILLMTVFFAGMYFIPLKPQLKLRYQYYNGAFLYPCNFTGEETVCDSEVIPLMCKSKCLDKPFTLTYIFLKNATDEYTICGSSDNSMWQNKSCDLSCEESLNENNECLYKTFHFWGFVIFMFVGCVSFNVVNSISDAICFDVIGDKGDYGKQRVWGTVGYGLTALLSGYISTSISKSDSVSYAPAFVTMTICAIVDMFICRKLKLPVIQPPENIFKEFKNLLKNPSVVTFLIFAVFVGVLDCIMAFFLLWYMEDLAVATNTGNIKLIEGLTIAAETLGGEIIFFTIAGKFLKRFGHVKSFSAAFFFYGLRFGLISIAPSPWWIILIEFLIHGPTYALAYSSIVAYANELAPPGASATMQGIAAGMDDGIGLGIGSLIVGLLFKHVGAKITFYIFCAFGMFCSFTYILLHKTILSQGTSASGKNTEYKTPTEAIDTTESVI